MDRRLGWEVERLILGVIIILSLLNFANLLSVFWGYVLDVVAWCSIAYVIYVISPTELFFGERHAGIDATIVLAYVVMSVKDLLGNAAANLPSLIQAAPSYVKFVPTEVVDPIAIAITKEEVLTYQITHAVPSHVVQWVVTQFTMTNQQVGIALVNGGDRILLNAFPTTANGSLLMFYNTILPNAGVIQQVSMVFGITLLVFASIFATYLLKVKKPSILAVLKEEGEPRLMRVIWVFLLLIGFFVIVFNLLFEWMTITNDTPLLLIGIVTLAVILIHRHLSSDELIEGLGKFGDDFYAKVLKLFMESRTILLGISGFLVLHLLTDVGNFIAPAMFPWYRTIYVNSAAGDHTPLYNMIMSSPHTVPVVLAYLLSTVGIVLLLVMPAVIWYKIFKIRSTGSHEHLPNWKGWQVGLILGCITIYILLPVFSFASIAGGDLVGVNLTSFAITPERAPAALYALTLGAVVFLLCAIIGMTHDYARRVLMLGPFAAAIIFFGVYVYYYFSSAFVYYATLLVHLVREGSFAVIPPIFLIFGFTILFFITGFFSFLYEVWRE